MGGISFDAPLPLLYESAKKLTSTSRSYQLVIDAPADINVTEGRSIVCRIMVYNISLASNNTQHMLGWKLLKALLQRQHHPAAFHV